jgi:hypothetical protein
MARRLASRLGLRESLLRAEGEIVQWTGAAGARSGVWTAGSPARDLMLADLRRQAAPALMDAATALILGDALEARYPDALLAAWQRVADAG